MGVPAFYRWISEKYPKIIQDILEKRPNILNGKPVPINLTEANPNGTEFDNLYIDMNGLIHPCSHPEDREAPTTEEEMYLNVTKYLDRLVGAIRPRKLLYLAIDGVAPRAKMNQQRSRRFKSSKETKERKDLMKEVLDEMEAMGYDTTAETNRQNSSAWDSNVITPGTQFMLRLSMFLKFYILDRMNKDPFWRGLTVVLSDASEPGEGEHKIMSYIRCQRAQPDYNPNLHHVLHGLDADLIMLALATHEMHFTILREKVFFGKKNFQNGNNADKGQENRSDAQKLLDAQSTLNGMLITCLHPGDEWVYSKQLEALHVHYLREYLKHEFECLITPLANIQMNYSLERIIDDFIFLCFFVGNDFLPHLPSLDIRDGALDFLIALYKEILPALGDYLTRPGGYLNLKQVDVVLSRVGEIEDQIFARKKQAEDHNEARMVQRKAQQQQQQQSQQQSQGQAQGLQEHNIGHKRPSSEIAVVEEDNSSTKEECEEESAVPSVSMPVKIVTKDMTSKRMKEKENAMLDHHKITISDGVKLHESGWKSRYYDEPYKAQNIADGGGLKQMCFSYIQGLCWVLQYYYQGVPSWQWYYPFHYAPFASDLMHIDTYSEAQIDTFTLSSPFSPIEQLLAVLPPTSVHALPPECHWLMLDPHSPIIDLYDENIPIDPNGKHLPWLWILLLPFIDETRITKAFAACQLTPETIEANAFGKSLVFVSKFHPSMQYLPSLEVTEGSKKLEKVQLTCQQGQETSGLYQTLPTTSKWYVPAFHTEITVPHEYNRMFDSYFLPIYHNVIGCYEYTLPTIDANRLDYEPSAMLPDATMKPWDSNHIHSNDFLMEKIPRLNKSGFNILNMFLRNSQEHRSRNAFNYHANNNNNYNNNNNNNLNNLNNNNFNYHNNGSNNGNNRYNNNNNNNYNNNRNNYNNNNGNGNGYNNNRHNNYNNNNYNNNNYNNNNGGGNGGYNNDRYHNNNNYNNYNNNNNSHHTTTSHTTTTGTYNTYSTHTTNSNTTNSTTNTSVLDCLRPQPRTTTTTNTTTTNNSNTMYYPPPPPPPFFPPSLPLPLPSHPTQHPMMMPPYYPPPPMYPGLNPTAPPYHPTAIPPAMPTPVVTPLVTPVVTPVVTHRVESLHSHHAVGRSVSSRPTRTVLLDTLPTTNDSNSNSNSNSDSMQAMRSAAVFHPHTNPTAKPGGRSTR